MEKNFVPKYKYFTNGKDVVVAVSTYRKKTVRGVAKCSPQDTFNLEAGKALAKARCDRKIADMKVKNMINLSKLYKDAMNYYWEKSKKFHECSVSAMEDRKAAEKEIENILKGL